jgi:hypothetical protein
VIICIHNSATYPHSLLRCSTTNHKTVQRTCADGLYGLKVAYLFILLEFMELSIIISKHVECILCIF